MAVGRSQVLVGIGVVIFAALVILGFAVSSNQGAADQQNKTTESANNQETAYENIVKESLKVYHARYSQYPLDYQTLLDDIKASPDLYGVNDEGISELSNVTSRLNGFSYESKTNGDEYLFTYKRAVNGRPVSVTSS